MNAERTAKCLSSRPATNRFIAVTASRGKEKQIQENSAKEIPGDLIPATKKCTKRSAMSVEIIAKSPLIPLATNRFIAANALAKVKKIKARTKLAGNLR